MYEILFELIQTKLLSLISQRTESEEKKEIEVKRVKERKFSRSEYKLDFPRISFSSQNNS